MAGHDELARFFFTLFRLIFKENLSHEKLNHGNLIRNFDFSLSGINYSTIN